MSRADDAVIRLYESADLRDELTDEEADTLLKWASEEIVSLDQSGADNAAFEAQTDALMKLVKSMNRYAGRQGQLSAQADDPLPTAIAARAVALGYAASPEQIAAAGTGDPAGTISALTALMSASADQAASLSASVTPFASPSPAPHASESDAPSPDRSSGDNPVADEV